MRKSNLSDDELGCLAYETYCKAVGGKAFNGDLLPNWAAMCKDEKKESLVVAWKRAGRAVASLTEKSMPAEVPVATVGPGSVKAYALTGAPSGRVSGALTNLSSLPPASRTLDKRTLCCGSRNLTLKTGHYVCPCGDHKEAIHPV